MEELPDIAVVDEQIKLNKHKYIMSRTDVKGNIEFEEGLKKTIEWYKEKNLL